MASSVPEIAHFMDNNANFVKTYGTPPTMTQIRAQGFKDPNGGALLIRKSQLLPHLLSSPLSIMQFPQSQRKKPLSLYQKTRFRPSFYIPISDLPPYFSLFSLTNLTHIRSCSLIHQVTCLDPRVVPSQFFGPGMNAAVVRNAGGRPTDDAVASMVVLRSLANLKNVIVIHHTDCGMTHLTQEQIVGEAKARIKDTPDKNANADAAAAGGWIEGRDYGCFTGGRLEEVVKRDVELLKGLKVLEGVNVWGMVMDTVSGVVKELDD